VRFDIEGFTVSFNGLIDPLGILLKLTALLKPLLSTLSLLYPRGQREYLRPLSFLDELERLLPEKHYHVVLLIIDRGYSLLDDEPIANQIAKEVWDFSQHIDNLVEDKHRELAEKYPEWFNANIKLKVKLPHPLNHSPSEHRPPKGKDTIMRQLSDHLRPYFVTKIGIAKMIAHNSLKRIVYFSRLKNIIEPR